RRQSPLTADFGQELLGGVGPLDRLSPTVALGEKAQDALADVVGALEVVGRERLPLQLAEHDLDLGPPGGIDRQPMEVDEERQIQAREPERQTLRRMRGAVVQDEVQARRHQTLPKSSRRKLWNSTKRLRSTRQGFAGVHQQTGEQLHGAPAL